MNLNKFVLAPKGYLYFIFARVIGLAAKPLFLMYLIAHNMKTESAMLSEIYLFLSGIFVLFASPVHFEYYKLFFEGKKNFLSIRKVFNTYLSNLIAHVMMVTPVIIILSFFISKNLLFTFFLIFFLITEKSFDEIQRFLQFSKDFISWSNIFLFKNILPIAIAISYSKVDSNYIIYTYMIVSIIAGVVIYFKYIPSFVRLKTIHCLKTVNLQQIKKYLITFFNQYFSKYLQGLSRANILNIDKWMALWLYSKSLLSELMLVGQFGNIINIGTNYATVSYRRSELLHSHNNISSLMLGYKVPAVALSLLVLVVVILFGFDILAQRGISQLNTMQIILIGTGYMLFSITQLLTEYLFWNASMKRVLSIDVIYYLIVISGGIYLYFIDSPAYISIFFLIANIFRFSSQILYVSTIGNR